MSFSALQLSPTQHPRLGNMSSVHRQVASSEKMEPVVEPPLKRQRRLPLPSLGFLRLSTEMQLSILQWCDSQALSRLEQTCRSLRGERPPPTLIQRAVQDKLKSQFNGAEVQRRSWPSLLRPIENAYKQAPGWDPTPDGWSPEPDSCNDLVANYAQEEAALICSKAVAKLANQPPEDVKIEIQYYTTERSIST